MKVVLQVAKLTKLWMDLRAVYFFPLSRISKALDTVSHDILINELRKRGLDEGGDSGEDWELAGRQSSESCAV